MTKVTWVKDQASTGDPAWWCGQFTIVRMPRGWPYRYTLYNLRGLPVRSFDRLADAKEMAVRLIESR